MVDKFLCFILCKNTGIHIPLNINIKECRYTADAHCCTVLCLDSCKISKIKPLNSFFCIGSRSGNIISVDLSHLFHSLKSLDLLCNFLTETDNFLCHCSVTALSKVFLFLLNEIINTVKSDSSVIAYDSSSSVCIRKTCHNLVLTCFTHLRSICIEYCLIMCFMIYIKYFVKFR